MAYARWIGVLIITVALVVSPVVAVTAVPVEATSPTDEADISPNRGDGDTREQARVSHLPTVDTTLTQVTPMDTSLVDIAPAELPGNGTLDDPYIITNASELQAVEDDLNAAYRLGADVNASDTIRWHGGDGFDPIGDVFQSFNGTFDGAGYTITGLHINRSTAYQVGLFGIVAKSGRISNVTLTDVVVNGSDRVGGLVGDNRGTVKNASATGVVTGSNYVGGLVGGNFDSGTVRNASATGVVTGSNYVGGLIGFNDNRGMVRDAFANASVTGLRRVGGLVGRTFGPVRNASATGTVTGSSEVGGLVGQSLGSVDNAFATGAVTGSRSQVGGLVGENRFSTVSNAFATGAVTGSGSWVGGLIGDNRDGTVTESYWDVNTTGQPTPGFGNGLTTAQMTGKPALTNMTGLPFGSVWQTCFGGYPELKTVEPASSPGDFSVDITSTNSPVTETGSLIVDAEIENVGDVSGTKTVELDTGVLGTDSTCVTLSPGENTTETLAVSTGPGDAGDYTASVSSENDTASTGVTVLAPANFSVSLGSTNSPVVEGATLSVDATIENTGDVGGSQTVDLNVGALGTDSTSLTLSPGENTTETFSISTGLGDAGDYTATVSSENDTASTGVTVLAPANFSVNIDATNVPVVEGTTLSVDATIENTGDVGGTQTVSLDVGALGTDSTSLTLSPGENTTETLAVSTGSGDAGDYTATVASENDTASTGVTVLAPANFSVKIDSTTSPLVENESLSVDAVIENVGDVAGTQTVSLEVDGLGTASTSLTLSPGENTTETISVPTAAGDSGDYIATVSSENDTANTNIAVLEPAEFSVSGLSAPASKVRGKNVTVNATVSNVGDVSGTADTEFVFNGSVISNETVTLGGGNATNVVFEVPTTGITSGTYEHGIQAGAGSQFTNITVQQPATFEVTAIEVPETATVNDTISINATFKNVGEVFGSAVVNITFSGSIVTTQQVSLNGSESVTVSATVPTADLSPSNYTYGITIGNASQSDQVTIEEQSDSTSTDASGQPGFGIGVALAALITVVLFASRRI